MPAGSEKSESPDAPPVERPEGDLYANASSRLVLASPLVDAFSLQARSVDVSPQRWGILIWSFGYIGAGRGFLLLGLHRHSILLGTIGAFLLAVGARMLFNLVPSAQQSSQSVTSDPSIPAPR